MANALQTYSNGSDVVGEIYEYDLFGNRVSTADALGNTIHRSYDPFGNVLSEWGATYPVRHKYDTAGWRTLLATTRDGVAWDETRWTYDAATGLCTAKTYADESSIAYTYTPDGLLLRTTYASGRWIENVYDDQRRLVGTFSSDGVNDVVLRRDAFGCETSSSNAVASYDYVLDRGGIATNETAAVGALSWTLRRTVDDQGRLASLGGNGGFATQTINYRADGRIGSIVTDDVAVDYAYSDDGYDVGYTLAVAGGVTFTRALTRDPCRRDLVLNVTHSAGGGFAYTYDALSRPVTRNGDTFAYNVRH